MIYIIAIICPPFALLLKGKIVQAIINAIFWVSSAILYVISLGFLGGLTFPIWILTMIWAVLSVRSARKEEQRQEKTDDANSNEN